MKIIWLEDEPETIDMIKYQIKEYCNDITVCQSFASFSDEIEEIDDKVDTIIIIDIRMIFNREMHFNCFDTRVKINSGLDSGFEYFNHCINGRFKQVKVVFFSSKPQVDTMIDAKRHKIDTTLIVSKEYTTELIEIIKGIQ